MASAPQTPVKPRQAPTAPPTTQPKQKVTSQDRYSSIDATLEELRPVMLEEARLVQVPYEYFKTLLPTPPSTVGESWDEVFTSLGAREKSEICDLPAWDQLPGGSQFGGHETKVFDSLEPIFKKTLEVLESVFGHKLKRESTLLLQPNSTPASDTKRNTSRPDGVMLAVKDGEPVIAYAWGNILVVYEFKKLDGKDLDGEMGKQASNAEQVIWGLQHMLWANPDRRFAFAITIEGESVRLWLAHRAAVLVSEKFRLQEDKLELPRVFAALAFAATEELGKDPTMVPKGDGPLPFHVTVGDDTYQLHDIIADHRARALHGSACRVFRATRVGESPTNGESPKEYAIKDVWRNTSRTPEGEIFSRVIDDIKKIQDQLNLPAGTEILDYFVDIVGAGDVRVAGQVDDTFELIMRGRELPVTAKWIETGKPRLSPETVSKGSHRSVEPNSEAPHGRPVVGHGPPNDGSGGRVVIPPRSHYRTSMRNVGKPLHHIGDLCIAFKALAHVVQACKMMCQAGWNHRDLSTGNIIVDAAGRGRLGDLEFAKKFMSEDGGHAERTGTLDFMAIEVVENRYKYESYAARKAGASREVAGVRHSAGHDLESVWWIAVFLLYNTVVGEATSDREAARQQRGRMTAYFEQGNRVSEFTSDDLVGRLLVDFPNRQLYEAAIDLFYAMLAALQGRYRVFEGEIEDKRDNQVFLPTHDLFIESFIKLSDHFKGVSCKTVHGVLKRD